MRILVTGGSGFIGTNLINHFVSEGHSLLNLDLQRPANKIHEYLWKEVNINDLSKFETAAIEFNPDYMVHLAARTDLNGLSLDDYETNIRGVENLLIISRKIRSLKKLLITSSMLVCELGYSPTDELDFKPSTVYGISKVHTERIVRSNLPNCDWLILRPTSIWGPWFGAPYKNFFELILNRKYFHIGGKSCNKTFGYVENTTYQIGQLLFHDTKNQERKVYYLGDYLSMNIELWANEIGDAAVVKIRRLPFFAVKMAALFGDLLGSFDIDFPMTSFRLKNMTSNNVFDLSNLQKLAPDLPVNQRLGIKRTLEWIQENCEK